MENTDTAESLVPLKRSKTLKRRRLNSKTVKSQTKRKSLRDIITRRQQNPLYIERKQRQQQETFVRLANEHFMDSNLEMVICKYHVSKGDVNIFMIGEQHERRNYAGTGIYEAFLDLYAAVHKNNIPVYLLVEIHDDELHYIHRGYNSSFNQIENVRSFFYKCIFQHNCGNVKVHWLDGNYSEQNEIIYNNPFSKVTETKTRKALSEMPQWIRTLYKDYLVMDEDGIFVFNPELEEIIETKGISSFLTENTIVMKELEKATHINPEFNLPFAIQFLNHVQATGNDIFFTARAVMDIYTVARIIKSHMKNVIIYHGANHAERVAMMLSQLSYTTNRIFPSEAERDEQLRLCTPGVYIIPNQPSPELLILNPSTIT